VAADGKQDRPAAMRDAMASAGALRVAGFRALMIDVSSQPQDAARQVADAMGARYLALPRADSHRISQFVSQAMKPQATAA
jgi:magnesium chelatase subunit D